MQGDVLQLIILIAVWAVWSLVGAAVLVWIGEKDRIRVALLAPVTGMSVVTLAISSLSLFGVSVQSASWPLLGFSVVAVTASSLRMNGFNLRTAGVVQGFFICTAALSIAIVGRSLIDVGGAWQGLMNEDAATNALAAEYFVRHPFFGPLDASTVIDATDYSPLATTIYVASGHRFADVMLLGLSAVLTGLHPDQVYMAHALMLRVALILVCASLVYAGRHKLWDALIAIAALSVSSIGSYNYLNQLISQTGGIALMVLIMILWARLLDVDRDIIERKRTLLLFAIVSAALLRYYPEVAPILGLAMFIASALVAPRYDAAQARWMLGAVAVAGLILVAMSNLSIPSTIAHVLNTLSIGSGPVVQSKGLMDYAFTPDVFPLLFGFIRFREVVADPWAALYVVGSGALALVSIWAAWRHRDHYPALFAILASLCVTFGVLWFKGEEFGTFKAMLFLQPFVCVTATVVISKLARAPVAALVVVGGAFAALNFPVTTSLVQSSTSDVHPVPTLVRADLLNVIASKTQISSPVLIDIQSYLLQQFVTLRTKSSPTFFATDAPGPITNRFEGNLPAYHAKFHREWFESYQLFKQTVNDQHRLNVKAVSFGCGPEPVRSSNFEIRNVNVAATARTIYAGGAIQPFNRSGHLNASLIVADPGSTGVLIVQRESSLGRWEVTSGPRNGERSTFFAEPDPMRQSPTMAAVGRYLLLEVINSSAGPVSLRMAFSRSFFGPSGARLPTINVHGATTVSVAGHGAGAIDMISQPVTPCVVGGRSYLMVDFGSEPEEFRKIPPLLYRALDIRYAPDSRRSVGFLRDISITASATEAATFQPPWAPKSAGSAVIGYEGVFEDGWLSSDTRIVVRGGSGKSRIRLHVEIDPSLVPAGRATPHLLIRDHMGGAIADVKLSIGANTVDLPIPQTGVVDARIVSDQTLELPNGDGRRVAGRLSGMALE